MGARQMKRIVVDTNVLVSGLLTHEILPYFEVLTVKPGRPFVTMDPSEYKFIWCAIEGHAEVIVSGDEHLLNLSPNPVPVFTVAEFIDAI